jgi:hypothetical protein
MAILEPSIDEIDRLATPLNEGERRTLDRLAELLNDQWYVFVQPHVLDLHPDFVICAPHHGVTIIEVKDWSRDLYRSGGGQLEVQTAGGHWERSGEDPLLKAHRYRGLFTDRVVSPPGANHFMSVRACVMMPQFPRDEADRLLKGATSLPDKASKYITVVGREALEERSAAKGLVWGGSTRGQGFDAHTYGRLLDRLAEPEAIADQRRRLVMSDGAKNVASNPSQAVIRRVRGPAGSGKTTGLAARAAELASEGKRVLALSFNITLAHYIQDLVRRHARSIGADHRLVDCIHFHGFCAGAARRANVTDSSVDLDLGTSDDDAFEELVARAIQAYKEHPDRVERYDAVLVDEGQDFKEHWWQFLRHQVRTANGEMLLAADAAQDIYTRSGWTTEEQMLRCGFSGKWTELTGSYRLPPDLVPVLREFASRYLDGAGLSLPSEPPDRLGRASAPTVRRWVDVDPMDIPTALASEVSAMVQRPGGPAAPDVVVLTNDHRTGERAMAEIEAHGLHVESLFAADPTEQRRRKVRFWPGVNALKGSTVHSFKGWEARGVVLAIESSASQAALGYVAMTRVKGELGSRPAFITVVNSAPELRSFGPRFERDLGPDEVPGLGGQLEFPDGSSS